MVDSKQPRKNNKEAEETFDQAVRDYLEALDYGDGLLVDWLLVTAQHIVEDDGSSSTGQAIHVSREQPLYRTSGLARYAMKKTDARMER